MISYDDAVLKKLDRCRIVGASSHVVVYTVVVIVIINNYEGNETDVGKCLVSLLNIVLNPLPLGVVKFYMNVGTISIMICK